MRISRENIEIELSEIKRLMGMGLKASETHTLDSEFEETISQGRELLKPRVTARELSVLQSARGKISLQDGIEFESHRLAKLFRDCEKVIIFVATIGSGLEAVVRRFQQEDDPLKAYIMDSVGSIAAESVVNVFNNRYVDQLEAKGYGATLRYSPGYCDWDIEEQKTLFRAMGSDSAGVTLTPSCLLLPRKSISGVFGVYRLDGDTPPRLQPVNPCLTCNLKTCKARRR